jgi:hypothetical protein
MIKTIQTIYQDGVDESPETTETRHTPAEISPGRHHRRRCIGSG